MLFFFGWQALTEIISKADGLRSRWSVRQRIEGVHHRRRGREINKVDTKRPRVRSRNGYANAVGGAGGGAAVLTGYRGRAEAGGCLVGLSRRLIAVTPTTTSRVRYPLMITKSSAPGKRHTKHTADLVPRKTDLNTTIAEQ